MSILHNILEEYSGEDILKLDGFDEAIVGISTNQVLVYDRDKIISILCEEMNEDDAWDFYGFNIESAYVGEKTPIIIQTFNQ